MASDSSHLFHKVHLSKTNSYIQNEQLGESAAKFNCKWNNVHYLKNCWVNFRNVKTHELLLNVTLVSYPAELDFHSFFFFFFFNIPYLAVKNIFNIKELISDKSRLHPRLNDKTIECYCGKKEKKRKLIFSSLDYV